MRHITNCKGVTEVKALTIRLEDEHYNQLKNIATSRRKISLAEAAREILTEGLAVDVLEDQRNIVREEVRHATEDALRPSVNRLAAITVKGTIISATATFLCMLVLNKVAGIEWDKVVRLYDDAKKKALEYVKDSTMKEG